MQILSAGKPEREKRYIFRCTKCGCVFIYYKHEVRKNNSISSYDWRDSTLEYVDCPQAGCGHENCVLVHKEYDEKKISKC